MEVAGVRIASQFLPITIVGTDNAAAVAWFVATFTVKGVGAAAAAATGEGETPQVEFCGAPEHVSATLPANPFRELT